MIYAYTSVYVHIWIHFKRKLTRNSKNALKFTKCEGYEKAGSIDKPVRLQVKWEIYMFRERICLNYFSELTMPSKHLTAWYQFWQLFYSVLYGLAISDVIYSRNKLPEHRWVHSNLVVRFSLFGRHANQLKKQFYYIIVFIWVLLLCLLFWLFLSPCSCQST